MNEENKRISFLIIPGVYLPGFEFLSESELSSIKSGLLNAELVVGWCQ